MCKRFLALVLSVIMIISLAGCLTKTTSSEVYYDEYIEGESQTTDDDSLNSSDSNNDSSSKDNSGKDDTIKNNSSKNSSNKNNTDKNNSSKDTASKNNSSSNKTSGISTSHQNTNKGKGEIEFKPVEDKGANYKVKGKVTIAVDTGRVADFDAMFDIMQKLYPNVEIKFDYWTHTGDDCAAEYLSTRAATGNIADIIWDDAGVLPTYITQGWVYPITKFVAKDPEAVNIPKNLKADYTYCGELYAVPHQAHFDCLVFNTDLLNKLGMKAPKQSWTMDEFENYLKAAASKYKSGVCVGSDGLAEMYSAYAHWLAMSYYNKNNKNNYGQWGFNLNTNSIDNDYIIQGTKKYFHWRTMLPGVDASYELYQKNADGTSQLESYLGTSENLWLKGKALIKVRNTAGILQDESDYGFNYTVRAMPNLNGHLSMHVDNCFITSACKDENIEAAYQLLRFMTFSTNGNLARLSMYEKENKDKYALNSRIYYPTTTSKTVLNKFNNLYCVTDTDKYLVANIPNSSRFDMHKLIPNMYNNFIGIVGPSLNDVRDGKDDSGSGMKEPIEKFNAAVKKTIDEMNKKIKDVQKDFNAKH